MTARRFPAGGKQGGRFLRLLAPLVVPGLVLAGIGTLIYRALEESARAWRIQEQEEAEREAQRRRIFARGDFTTVYELCRDGWREAFAVYHEPRALAWTRRSLDGYFLQGTDSSSWRQLRCTAAGVERGARVAVPLRERSPAEDPSGSETAREDRWQLALQELAATPLTGEELAVELLPDPSTGTAIIRRWRGLEGGARAHLEPADAPSFELLIAEPELPLAAGAAPPPLRSLARHRWSRETDTALAVVEKALPAGAGIVELTLTDDRIELSIESPTPAFDGDPPAPYGDLEFDEYGIAESSWWYPRTDPGFGCPRGRPLAAVRAELAAARGRLAPGAVSRAWYSCSPAYSDGRHGVWNLVVDGS